jgi:hypothetical protein
MPHEKVAIIRVTTTRDYYVPIIEQDVDIPAGNIVTKINGWKMNDVIEDWFKTHDINSYHASRDGHRIGNSIIIEDIEILSEGE